MICFYFSSHYSHMFDLCNSSILQVQPDMVVRITDSGVVYKEIVNWCARSTFYRWRERESNSCLLYISHVSYMHVYAEIVVYACVHRNNKHLIRFTIWYGHFSRRFLVWECPKFRRVFPSKYASWKHPRTGVLAFRDFLRFVQFRVE